MGPRQQTAWLCSTNLHGAALLLKSRSHLKAMRAFHRRKFFQSEAQLACSRPVVPPNRSPPHWLSPDQRPTCHSGGSGLAWLRAVDAAPANDRRNLRRQTFPHRDGLNSHHVRNGGALIEKSLPVLGRPTGGAGRNRLRISALCRDKSSRIARYGGWWRPTTRSLPSMRGLIPPPAPLSGPRLYSYLFSPAC